MSAAIKLPVRGEPAAILDRHAIRRTTGVPTVSMLVGPIGAGRGTWRRWADTTGRSVIVAKGNRFPCAVWIRYAAEEIDLAGAAIHFLARRAGRDPDELLAEWRDKTPADCERFWNTLAPKDDDDLLRAIATLAVVQGSESVAAAALSDLGESIVPTIARLSASANWPGVLYVAASADELSSVGREAAKWAMRVPALSIAITAPAAEWDEFAKAAPESRAKALLREGELRISVIDATMIERTLIEAGAGASAAAAIAAAAGNGLDEGLFASAVAAVRATAVPPTTDFYSRSCSLYPKRPGGSSSTAHSTSRSARDRPRSTSFADRRESLLNSTVISTFSPRTATVVIGKRIGSCNDGGLSCYDSWPKTSSLSSS
jgi:hypothetical protein